MIYEMRIYEAIPGKLPALNERFAIPVGRRGFRLVPSGYPLAVQTETFPPVTGRNGNGALRKSPDTAGLERFLEVFHIVPAAFVVLTHIVPVKLAVQIVAQKSQHEPLFWIEERLHLQRMLRAVRSIKVNLIAVNHGSA